MFYLKNWRQVVLSILLMMIAIPPHQATSAVPTRNVSYPFVISFPRSVSSIEPDFMDNAAQLAGLRLLLSDSLVTVEKLTISGFASPEGVYEYNIRLARQRRESLALYLISNFGISRSAISYGEAALSWKQVADCVDGTDYQYKNEILDLVAKAVDTPDYPTQYYVLRSLKRLDRGKAWLWLDENIFPKVRTSGSALRIEVTEPVDVVSDDTPEPPVDGMVEEESSVEEIVESVSHIADSTHSKLFRMALSTNMLYDIAMIPNLGAEFFIGDRFSVRAFYGNSWWRLGGEAPRHRWQTYGGEVGARYWLQRGYVNRHHYLGLFGTVITYDFSPGDKGVMANEKNPNWAVSLEYGYRLPVSRRFSIDFNICIGYMGGRYQTYDILDKHRVWTATKQRRYFGPTRLGIDLVWLIGRDFHNVKKGGNGL